MLIVCLILCFIVFGCSFITYYVSEVPVSIFLSHPGVCCLILVILALVIMAQCFKNKYLKLISYVCIAAYSLFLGVEGIVSVAVNKINSHGIVATVGFISFIVAIVAMIFLLLDFENFVVVAKHKNEKTEIATMSLEVGTKVSFTKTITVSNGKIIKPGTEGVLSQKAGDGTFKVLVEIDGKKMLITTKSSNIKNI